MLIDNSEKNLITDKSESNSAKEIFEIQTESNSNLIENPISNSVLDQTTNSNSINDSIDQIPSSPEQISKTNKKKSSAKQIKFDENKSKPQKLIPTEKFDFIPQYARNYLHYLINVQNKSEKTVYEYYLDLRTFFRFISQKKNVTNEDNIDLVDASDCPINIIEKLTLAELYEYLNYVREGRDNNVRARMRKTSSLKSFYKYLCKQAIISENPTTYLEAPKQPKDLPIHLTINDSIKLLESIDGPYKVRNYAIITLFLNCGLRLSELVGINLSNINGNSLRVTGKGNKERILYLNQTCIDALTDYLKVRPEIDNKDRNALFISKQGKRISRRMVQTLVEKHIKQSGLDSEIYSTHKLRHTAATLMYQNGVDVRVLQELLGHANLGTTQIYTHLADKQVEDAIQRNPLNNKKIRKKENTD